MTWFILMPALVAGAAAGLLSRLRLQPFLSSTTVVARGWGLSRIISDHLAVPGPAASFIAPTTLIAAVCLPCHVAAFVFFSVQTLGYNLGSSLELTDRRLDVILGLLGIPFAV